MRLTRCMGHFIAVAFLLLVGVGGYAQTPAPANDEYQPQPGQIGRDVMWIPTELALTETMLNLAEVTPRDFVIDLGSGDGRIVIMAAKRGARSLGIEYNPDLVALSKRNALREGVADRARFVQGDIFESDFSQATVLTLFLLPELNLQLRPAILNLKPGTRVVSNSFDMGEWQADREITLGRAEGCDTVYCRAFLWTVPAKVDGTWKFSQGELDLRQEFQLFSGTARVGQDRLPVVGGRLAGDRISFGVGDARYTGRVTGAVMEGTVRSGGSTTAWSARRITQ
ncbi:MAG: class I SAM-dependent methyltransferase [Syntrophales bacterium]